MLKRSGDSRFSNRLNCLTILTLLYTRAVSKTNQNLLYMINLTGICSESLESVIDL